MPMPDSQFVALNLPRNAKFKKNGQTLTITDAITLALAETQRAGNNVRELAIAMLLRMLAADYPFASMQAADVQYTRSQLLSMADYWEGRAPEDTSTQPATIPGGISSIPLTMPDDPIDPCWPIRFPFCEGHL